MIIYPNFDDSTFWYRQYPTTWVPSSAFLHAGVQPSIYLYRHHPTKCGDTDALSKVTSKDTEDEKASKMRTEADSHSIKASVDEDSASSSSSSRAVIFQNRTLQVSKNSSNYELTLDLPGVKQKDVQVDIDDGTLKIKAQRTFDGVVKSTVQDFAFGEDSIDAANAQAKLNDGVLTVFLPKMESKQKASSDLLEVPVVSGAVPSQSLQDSSQQNVKTLVSLDVPGVSLKDVKVKYHHGGGGLSVEADRYQGEKIVSNTRRSYHVNPKTVDTDTIKAFLVDGVLTVIAHDKNPDPPIRVPVSTAVTPSKKEADDNENESNTHEDLIKEDTEMAMTRGFETVSRKDADAAKDDEAKNTST